MKKHSNTTRRSSSFQLFKNKEYSRRMVKDYAVLLNNIASAEQDIQDFLEQRSELIPMPWMLNHGLHLDVMISKFPLDTSLATDLTYLTKSTTQWYAVFMELEDPSKRIFTGNRKTPRFSADFNAALGQLEDWKLFVESHADAVRERLSPLLRPLGKNRVRFKFVLMYGRNSELGSNQDRIDRFAAQNSNDRILLTYDSLARNSRMLADGPKNNLTLTRRAFKLKHLNNPLTGLFTYLRSHELAVPKEHHDELSAAGYRLDRWRKGSLLRVNHNART
jgi:antiviral defense system Shedu protein SduA